MSKDITLGHIAFIEMGQSPDSRFVNESEVGLPFLQGNAEFGDVFPDHHLYCSHPKKICKSGDILISVRAPVGALNKANQSYCIGRGLAAIRFTEADASFGWHLLNHSAIWLQSVAQGSTFEAVSKKDLHTFPVQILPPLPEQRAIADILDTVDEAIQQTDALIAKLQRIKAGRLHDLLTRGLDENGQLRDPIAHPEQFHETPLGLLPKAWEVKRLEECTHSTITYGIVQAGPHIENGIPYIRTGDMSGDRLYIDNLLRTSTSIASSYRRSEVHTGEIVCAIRATVGKVLEVPPELDGANLTQGTARIAPKEDINNRFLLWMLRSESAQLQFALAVKGTTFAEITLESLRSIPLSIPKQREEQDKIASILDQYESYLQAEFTQNTKLRRVKQGLMDDLLTGRVRVADVRLDERLEQA